VRRGGFGQRALEFLDRHKSENGNRSPKAVDFRWKAIFGNTVTPQDTVSGGPKPPLERAAGRRS